MRRIDEKEDDLVAQVIAAADKLAELTNELKSLIDSNRERTALEDAERERADER